MEGQKDTIERQSWFKDVHMDLEASKIIDWSFSILADRKDLYKKIVFTDQFFSWKEESCLKSKKSIKVLNIYNDK